MTEKKRDKKKKKKKKKKEKGKMNSLSKCLEEKGSP